MEEIIVGDHVIHDERTTIHKVVGFSKGWVNCESYIKVGWEHNSFRRARLTKVNLEDSIGEDIKKHLIDVGEFIQVKLGGAINNLIVIKAVSVNHNNIYIDIINEMTNLSEGLFEKIKKIKEELSDEV